MVQHGKLRIQGTAVLPEQSGRFSVVAICLFGLATLLRYAGLNPGEVPAIPVPTISIFGEGLVQGICGFREVSKLLVAVREGLERGDAVAKALAGQQDIACSKRRAARPIWPL